MPWALNLDYDSYESAREQFAWEIPEGYNIAHDLVGKHDDFEKVALYQAYPDGRRETYAFADINRASSQLADQTGGHMYVYSYKLAI